MCSITWWHFQWPWRTHNPVFKVTAFWSRMSQKRCILGTRLLKNTNRKPCIQHLSNDTTLNDLEWPLTPFQGHDIFWSQISEKGRVLKTKLLLHNRKLYLTYGMVLCLVTLTDLQTCRAGLSASAELLVLISTATSHCRVWNNSSRSLYNFNFKV